MELNTLISILKQLLYISRMAAESSFADTKTKAHLIKQINEWSID